MSARDVGECVRICTPMCIYVCLRRGSDSL